MPDDKFPKPTPSTPEEPKRLFVSLDDGFSPEILIQHIKEKKECAFIVGKDGGIFLGTNHKNMTGGLSGTAFWVNDGYVRNTRPQPYEIFYSGSWSLSSQHLYTMLNTEELQKGIGIKIIKYLESIGLNNK
ncbi:MAG: hypothetical protein KA515_00730 [Candidatus Pacebacteria bacterium]|nr:hypothetical protein [Candidatus Paceibacterota bacterium]